MATWRFYLAARTGDGKSQATHFRAKLSEYIVNDGTQDFQNWKLDGRDDQFLCLAVCSPEKHVEMEADADIEPQSPEFDTREEALAWFDAQNNPRMKMRHSKELVRIILRG